MKELQVKIENNGESYISLKSIANACSIAESTFRDNYYKIKQLIQIRVNGIGQIHEESLFDVVYEMSKLRCSTPQLLDLLKKLKTAGSRSFIYSVGGITLKPFLQGNQQLSLLDQMEANLAILRSNEEELIRLQSDKADNSRVDQLEKSVRGNQCPNGFLPMQKLADFFGVSNSPSFRDTVKQVRSVEYSFSSGTGGLRKATSYKIEDVRVILEG